MDKLVQLNREYWGRIHDMCEGTNVKPRDCVRYRVAGNLYSYGYEPHNFKDILENTKFDLELAVAILEDKPVFVGDKL